MASRVSKYLVLCLEKQAFSLCQPVIGAATFIYQNGIWVDQNEDTVQ